jgi:ligand-binding sensor domain-containing protein
MKKSFWEIRDFAFLILLLIGTSCNEQGKKNLTKENLTESSVTSVNQQKIIKSHSLNEGDNVHCGLQDKAGNLWFGTTGDGIYKYDGKLFTQFTETNGLNSNTVWCVFEDKSGVIWVGTGDGIYLYDDNRFNRIQIASAEETQKITYDVWSIMQDRSGKLWFATGMGVYVYDGKSFTSFDVGIERGIECKFSVEYILEDEVGNFWFGGRCNPGVYRYDGKTITHFKPNGDDWTWPVLQDKNGNIWFSSWKGAYKYDGESFRTFTKDDGLAGNMVARIVEDRKGNLWFGGDGLSLYDGKSFTKFSSEDGLFNTSIWTILEDNSGNFWVGTRKTGLYLYDGKRFTKFSE